MSFSVGDVVWAKVPGYPFWPAQIINPKYASKIVQQQRQDGQNALIRFFGTHDHAWMDRSKDLELWGANKTKHSAVGMKSRSHAKFAIALKEVEDHVDFNNSEASKIRKAPSKRTKRKREDGEDESSVFSPPGMMSPSGFEPSQVPSSLMPLEAPLPPNPLLNVLDEILNMDKVKEKEGEVDKGTVKSPITKKRKKDSKVDFLVPSTPIAVEKDASPHNTVSTPIVIPDQTPAKKVEMSPLTPIQPQSFGSFPTPSGFAQTQIYQSQAVAPTQVYASQIFAQTQVYRSPIDEKKDKVLATSPSKEPPVKRLVYEDAVDKSTFLVPPSPSHNPPRLNIKANPTLDPKGKRKRGRGKVMDEGETSEAEKPKENLSDSAPLFDDATFPNTFAEKTNQSSPVARMTSPLVNKAASRTKLALTGEALGINDSISSPTRLFPIAATQSQPPFELAVGATLSAPKTSLSESNLAFEEFFKEFATMKSELSSLREKVSQLEAEKKSAPQPQPPADPAPLPQVASEPLNDKAELIQMIEKQSVQNKALKKELKEALKSQKDQIQRILQDQKRFLESSVETSQASFEALRTDIAKAESKWKSDLQFVTERIAKVETKAKVITSAFLETAETLKASNSS